MTGTLTGPPLFDAAELDDDVEPRFRVRRVAVRRAERRRRRRLILTVVGLLALVGGAVAALYSPLLDVDHLDIEGLSHLDADEVGRASGIAQGQQMVDLDTDAAVSGVAALPWVQRVSVTRQWPDTVEVRVVERRPIARVVVVAPPDPAAAATPPAGTGTPPAGTAAALVVTTDAMVAGPERSLDGELPLVRLDPAAAPVVGKRLSAEMGRAIQMISALPSTLASQMVGASVSDSAAVDVELRSGAHLLLGTGDDVEAKFVAAESILGGAVVLDGIERVDVSVPSAPVIQRRGGPR